MPEFDQIDERVSPSKFAKQECSLRFICNILARGTLKNILNLPDRDIKYLATYTIQTLALDYPEIDLKIKEPEQLIKITLSLLPAIKDRFQNCFLDNNVVGEYHETLLELRKIQNRLSKM